MEGIGIFVPALLIAAAAAALPAQNGAGAAAPSVKNGDPPPGSAAALSIPRAQEMLKEAIQKRYTGTLKDCQRVLFVKGCFTYAISPASDIRVRNDRFEMSAPYTVKLTAAKPDSSDGKVLFNFKKLGTGESKEGEIDPVGYVKAFRLGITSPQGNGAGGGIVAGKESWYPDPVYAAGYLPAPESAALPEPLFVWTSAAPAQEFADAFNRLLYAGIQDEEFKTFIAAAKAWRDNPVKPQLNTEADKHWVLAENAVKERNLDEAVKHYEAALEIQPMWPTGWYDLAMIYGEQKQYADAANAMKRYLELVPDASDAKAARDQVIIWDDKSKQ